MISARLGFPRRVVDALTCAVISAVYLHHAPLRHLPSHQTFHMASLGCVPEVPEAILLLWVFLLAWIVRNAPALHAAILLVVQSSPQLPGIACDQVAHPRSGVARNLVRVVRFGEHISPRLAELDGCSTAAPSTAAPGLLLCCSGVGQLVRSGFLRFEALKMSPALLEPLSVSTDLLLVLYGCTGMRLLQCHRRVVLRPFEEFPVAVMVADPDTVQVLNCGASFVQLAVKGCLRFRLGANGCSRGGCPIPLLSAAFADQHCAAVAAQPRAAFADQRAAGCRSWLPLRLWRLLPPPLLLPPLRLRLLWLSPPSSLRRHPRTLMPLCTKTSSTGASPLAAKCGAVWPDSGNPAGHVAGVCVRLCHLQAYGLARFSLHCTGEGKSVLAAPRERRMTGDASIRSHN